MRADWLKIVFLYFDGDGASKEKLHFDDQS